MSDFSLPTIDTGYIAVLADLLARDVDAITLCLSDPTNVPTGAIKYSRANNTFQEWSGSAWVDKNLAILGGGTGAATAAGARANLGLGTMAVQDSNNVNITGGAIGGTTDIDATRITSGVMAQARLGSGSGGTGVLFLADDQTYKAPTTVLTGSGLIWYTNTPPTGYLLCDGSAVSRATYAALFGVIATTYGVGDGATTFNLPDLRQRFPIGKSASGTASTLATSGGAIDHTHTSAAHTHTYTDIINHTHTITITDPGHTHNIITGSGGTNGALAGVNAADQNGGTITGGPALSNTTGISASSSNPGGGVSTGTTASTTPGSTGSNNPPYLVVNFIIKT